jgi:spermidine dehydrogenase
MRKLDRELGMQAAISRRDFLNGLALAAGGSVLSAAQFAYASPLSPDYYPPILTGLRGSHPGAFEVAHALRDGKVFDQPEDLAETYDLIVVGGGISGLSAAYFYRKQYDPQARILILDNHDDFGGHAKRNEFWHDGRMYLRNGGTLNVEAPSQYSTVASGLLAELGIDRTRYFQGIQPVKDRYKELGLQRGTFFNEQTHGRNYLATGVVDKPTAEVFRDAPLSQKARDDLVRITENPEDWLPGLSPAERRARLNRISYRDFLVDMAGCEPEVASLFDPEVMGLFAVGADAIPAAYAYEMGYFPGFGAMEIAPFPESQLVAEPGGQHGREDQARADRGDPDMYFPDGNATITRLLVRSLIPGTVPGSSMEDVVTARVDYSRLDDPGQNIRIRLNSTVTNVRHADSSTVSVTYVNDGVACRVSARSAVLACWHSVIPFICPELPAEQKAALSDGVKSPVVYTSVLVSNWRPFVKAGVSNISAPGSYHGNVGLGTSLRMGDYTSGQDPDQPNLIGMSRFPCQPGLSRREQHRIGRNDLFNTSFETFERNIRTQLTDTLAPYGFDAARDILAITVNRWPHGYTYSYNPLFDPEEWAFTTTDSRPCVKARQPFGRLAIANADAAASPHTDAAINEAYRAVAELGRMGSRCF